MKTLFSLPTNDGFFNRYATLIPTLRKLGILSQFINAFTEFGIVYAVMFSMMKDHWGNFAPSLSFMGAIIGTGVIELGLRQFLPYSCRAILYKRFKGLDAWMTGFILLTCIALFSCSIALSFKGSHSLVETTTPAPAQLTTTTADTQLNDERTKTRQSFTSDSIEIAQRYNLLINSQRNVFNASIDKERTTLSKYQNAPQKYTTLINNLKEKIKSIEVERGAKIADLEQQKAKEMQEANSRKNGNMERITANHANTTTDISNQNTTARVKSETKIQTYGSGLAWFTLIFHFVLILAVAIEEINNKGSGIEQVAQPNQYHFSESIFASFLNTMSDKWNYNARTLIQRWANKTPAPPRPIEPPTLYELSDWKPSRTTLPRVASQIVAQAQSNGAKTMNANATRHVFRSKALKEETPLPAPASDPTAHAHDNALSTLENAANLQQTANDGAHENALSTPQPSDKIIQVDSSLKPCAWCNELFRPRTTWQKFCKTDCKLADHEQRHGQPFDIAKAKFKKKVTA
jgi:hypothetical protein